MLTTSLDSAGRRGTDSRKSRKDILVSVSAVMDVNVRFLVFSTSVIPIYHTERINSGLICVLLDF